MSSPQENRRSAQGQIYGKSDLRVVRQRLKRSPRLAQCCELAPNVSFEAYVRLTSLNISVMNAIHVAIDVVAIDHYLRANFGNILAFLTTDW